MDFDSVEEPKLDFKEVDHRYAQLKGLHEAGILTDQEFGEKLNHLMVQDGMGRWWSKSLKSGAWHYYDGSSWVKGIPPGLQSTPQAAPSTEGRLSLGTIAMGAAGGMWLVVHLVAVLGIMPWVWLPVWALAGTLVGLWGVSWGLHIQQAERYRRQATIGLILASISFACLLILIVLSVLLGESTGSAGGLLLLLLPLGMVVEFLLVLLGESTGSAGGLLLLLLPLGMVVEFIVTGVAYVRTRLLPTWGSIALIALIVGSVVQPLFFASAGDWGRLDLGPGATVAAYMIGCMWLALGYAIWSRRRAATPSR